MKEFIFVKACPYVSNNDKDSGGIYTLETYITTNLWKITDVDL